MLNWQPSAFTSIPLAWPTTSWPWAPRQVRWITTAWPGRTWSSQAAGRTTSSRSATGAAWTARSNLDTATTASSPTLVATHASHTSSPGPAGTRRTPTCSVTTRRSWPATRHTADGGATPGAATWRASTTRRRCLWPRRSTGGPGRANPSSCSTWVTTFTGAASRWTAALQWGPQVSPRRTSSTSSSTVSTAAPCPGSAPWGTMTGAASGSPTAGTSRSLTLGRAAGGSCRPPTTASTWTSPIRASRWTYM
mmetsp:Transcript_130469/g.363524  ORF Transcript_130469/g.363524 Transcript_130469/m.363524 type:complete len:251 (+) Transcript_130469:363-1115(+)